VSQFSDVKSFRTAEACYGGADLMLTALTAPLLHRYPHAAQHDAQEVCVVVCPEKHRLVQRPRCGIPSAGSRFAAQKIPEKKWPLWSRPSLGRRRTDQRS